MKDGACTRMADRKIFLCFGKYSFAFTNECRWSSDLLFRTYEATPKSMYSHLKIDISASASESVIISSDVKSSQWLFSETCCCWRLQRLRRGRRVLWRNNQTRAKLGQYSQFSAHKLCRTFNNLLQPSIPILLWQSDCSIGRKINDLVRNRPTQHCSSGTWLGSLILNEVSRLNRLFSNNFECE